MVVVRLHIDRTRINIQWQLFNRIESHFQAGFSANNTCGIENVYCFLCIIFIFIFFSLSRSITTRFQLNDLYLFDMQMILSTVFFRLSFIFRADECYEHDTVLLLLVLLLLSTSCYIFFFYCQICI